MDQQRVFLWVGLLLVLWLNVDAWMKDYATPGVAPAAQVATAPAATGAPPASTPAPAGGKLADELPSVVGSGSAPAGAVPEPTEMKPPGSVVHVVTDVLDLEVSLEGGEFIRAELPEYPLHKEDPATPVRLFNTDPQQALFVFQSGLTTGEAGRAEPNHKAIFNAERTEYRLADGATELRVPLTWSDGAGLSVTKTFEFHRGAYAVNIDYRVTNSGPASIRLASYAQLLRHWEEVKRSRWNVETYSFRGPAFYDGASYQKLDIDDKEDQALSRPVTNGWVAAMQHHFVAAIIPAAGQPYQYELRVKDRDYMLRVVGPAQSVPAGGSLAVVERLYVGPKLQDQLKVAGPELERTADYGKLTILAQPLFWLLAEIHDLIGNWGWSIVLVTILIKLVFYKLSETSGRSMAKMRTVAPRLKAIQERHKDDREGQARAMMELYKREKINPVAGCLPILVQIPFFLAFYWVLLESVEMRQAPFMGWIQDLSARDPYFVLPILMGGAMFLQFKLNPTPPDPMQAKVFAFMPVIMTVMFMWFPSGLVLYWLTNTGLSIAQQWKINRVVEAEAKKQRAG
jgi:YidC/Oxa1 family membrane protein insertase